MAPLRLSFVLRSAYDLLPSNANLVKWGKTDDPSCPLCNSRQTLEHVLSACKVALAQERYTWRHNQVLKELTQTVRSSTVKAKVKCTDVPATFQTAGGHQTWPQGAAVLSRKCKPSLLDAANKWDIAADLPEWNTYPEVIKRTGMRPDIALYAEEAKEIILVELIVPHETRMKASHVFKTEKYTDLADNLRASSF